MARLMIRLLGPLQVSLDGVELNGFDSNKVRALLAYLIVESDRAHSRRSLAGLLWPDSPEESAQANLRHVLANLRKIIGDHDASPPFLTISRQSIQFNLASDVWCDVLAFSPNGKNPEAQEPSLQSLEANIASYRGSFLEGFFVTGSASFEEWTLLKRERLERIAASTLEQLVSTCHLLDEKEKALGYAWRLIELEPWREASWQKLIWLLSLYGQRGAALAQFDACRRALEKELGVKPSVETIALYESIRDGNGENGGGTFPAPGAFTPTLAVQPVPHSPEVGVSPASPSSNKASSKPRLGLFSAGCLIFVSLGLLLWSGFLKRPVSSRAHFSGQAASTGRIVWSCEGLPKPEICVRNPETGWVSQLTQDGAYRALSGLAWSPDGKEIVFSALKPGKIEAVLYQMAADGSNESPLVDGTFVGQFPAWSPDGEWISFSRRNQLWLVHADGSGPRPLLEGQTNEIAYMETSWSPDGRQIAFFKQVASANGVTSQVWTIERNGQSPHLRRSFTGKVHGPLGWSPDSTQIACFCAFENEAGRIREEALVFHANGEGEVQSLDIPPQSWFPSYWPEWDQ